MWLPFTIAFILFAAWFCFFVLPDILTNMWLHNLPKP
jgi:hypothetical protein